MDFVTWDPAWNIFFYNYFIVQAEESKMERQNKLYNQICLALFIHSFINIISFIHVYII